MRITASSVRRDFHIHTCYSDGAYRPSEVVKLAATRGVSEMSVTDHDSIKGLREAALAAEERGINFMSGIELTSFFCWDERERPRMLHILGYGFDLEKAENDEEFTSRLAKIHRLREDYYINICIATRENPFMLTTETGWPHQISVYFGDLMKEVSVGTPSDEHLAIALRKKVKKIAPKFCMSPREILEAFFFQNPKTWSRFERKSGLTLRQSPEIRERFLTPPVVKDRDYYYTDEAVSKIISLGGIASLAHSGDFMFGVRNEEELGHVISLGIRALEVWHSKNTDSWINVLLNRARIDDLGVTGGSDFHIFIPGRKNIGDFVNREPVPCGSIEEILSHR